MISNREWDQITETFQDVVDKIVARFQHDEKNIRALLKRIEKLEGKSS